MGTAAKLLIIGATPRIADQARRRVEDLERLWSRFLPHSELSRLNDSPGVPVVVSPETFRLVSDAIDAWEQSGGVFDPTVEPTMTAAGYDRSFERLANGHRLAAADHLPAPGPAEIELHPYGNAIELPPGVRLDLGGIAKGAAADLVAQELLDAGAAGCCVNIGGDIRVMGESPRAEGWQITLDCPGGHWKPVIGLRQGAVCTSTTTKRRWDTDTGVEHHLRDPVTGAPLDSGLVSVTVISARATQAEVITKLILAAGPGAAALVGAGHGVTGLTVAEDGTTTALAGFEPFVAAALVGQTA